jgi:DNA-directed RNA polymerase subunit beta
LDIAVHKVETQADGSSLDVEVDLMADLAPRRTPPRPVYESLSYESLEDDD